MAGVLFINPASGNGAPDPDELADAARRRGVEPRELPAGDARELRRAVPENATAIGVAGGDGSLAEVAAVAIERDVPFVCIPYGTRNHFARDLGLARSDPIGALDAFAGPERRIDVGRAGERLFLNNVSLGLYARLVHRREHHRRRREALARIRAWALAITHREPLAATVDGRHAAARLILVANNSYVLDLPSLGARERLDEGLLSLYVVDGRIDEQRGKRFVVDVGPGRVEAAVDGEPAVLPTPIEFRIEPRALRVLVPPGPQDR